MTEPRRTTIVVADDHPIFRDGLHRLLDADPSLHVVGLAADGREALEAVRLHKPDVLLLDLAMPGQTGMDVLRSLADVVHAPKIIMLTAAIDELQTTEAVRLGAQGVVLKEAATSVLLKAIHTVVAGQYWIGRGAVASVIDALRQAAVSREPKPDRFGLTPRQLEIVAAIASGAGNREIARQLGITEDTVKQHLTAIYDKCGVSSRVELAVFAVHHRIVAE